MNQPHRVEQSPYVQIEFYAGKLRLKFIDDRSQLRNLLYLQEGLVSRVDDDDFLEQFACYCRAVNSHRMQLPITLTRESDLQEFRNCLNGSLIGLNLWLLDRDPKMFMAVPNHQEFLKLMYFFLEVENEDIGINILQFFIKLCEMYPESVQSLVTSMLESIMRGYQHLLKTDIVCQLRILICPFEQFHRENLIDEGKSETKDFTKAVTCLSCGYSSLRLWNHIPRLLCCLLSIENSPYMEQICDMIVPVLKKFVGEDTSKHTKLNSFSEVAQIEYMRAQLCSLKFLFCLANKKDGEKVYLLIAFLKLIENCPQKCNSEQLLSQPHLKYSHEQLWHELWNAFDEILDPVILDLITDVYPSLDKKYLRMVIGILLTKLYDSTVEMETQCRIFKLLQVFVGKYLREKPTFCMVLETTMNLIDALSQRLKLLLRFELDTLKKINGVEFRKVHGMSSLCFNICFKRKINMASSPRLPLYTECRNFFKQIISRIYTLTPYGREYEFFQDDIVLTYSTFLKYAIRVVSEMYRISLNIENNMQEEDEEELILLTLSAIYGKLHPRVFLKVLLPNINRMIECMVGHPTLKTIRMFFVSILNSKMETSCVLSALLLESILSLIENIYPKGETLTGKLKGVQDKCQVYFTLLLDVLQANPRNIELRKYFIKIVEKCVEMLEAPILWKLSTFYDTMIITLFENVSTEKLESAKAIPVVELQSILLRLNKLLKSTKSVDFQNRILDVCLIIFKNTPKVQNLAVLPLVMIPTVKALHSTASLASKALKNLTEMEAYGSNVLIHHLSSSRREFMEGLLNCLRIGKREGRERALHFLVKFRELLNGLDYQFECEKYPEASIQLTSDHWKGSSKVHVPMEKVLESALRSVLCHTDGDLVPRSVLPHTLVLVLGYFSSSLSARVQGKCLDPLRRFNSRLPLPNLCLCRSESARETHKTALKILFAQSKENRQEYLFVKRCVLHYILVAFKQHFLCASEQAEIAGHDPLRCSLEYDSTFIDPFVVIDAVVDLLKIEVNVDSLRVVLKLILDTSTSVVGLQWVGNFNLVWYYIHIMCRLCYEYDSASHIAGCIMMEVLLQVHSSVPEISKLLPDFVQALLNVLGCAETEESIKSARVNLERICSRYEKCQNIDEEPWKNILKVLCQKIWLPSEIIRIEVSVWLTRISKNLKMSIYEITQLPDIQVQQPESVFLPELSQLEILFHSLYLEHGNDQEKKIETMMTLSEMISSDCEDLHSCPSKQALFEDLFLESSTTYTVMNEEDRRHVTNQLREGLKIPHLADMALCCLKKLYSLCKPGSMGGRELFDELFNEVNDEVTRLEANALWYYIYLFFVFEDQFKRKSNKVYLENLQEVRSTLCQGLSRDQLRAILEALNRALAHMICDDEPASSNKEMEDHLGVVRMLLSEIQKQGFFLIKGLKNDIYELSIPLIQYYPKSAFDHFFSCECSCPLDRRSYVSFLKYVLRHEKTTPFLSYLRDTLCSSCFRDVLPRDWIFRNELYLLYYFCKYTSDFKHSLAQNKAMVTKLRTVWNYFHHVCFSRTTREFTHLKEYKQLLYCLVEIFTVTRDVELLFELLRAPVEHFPSHFEFMLSALDTKLVSKGTFLVFRSMFDIFLRHADAKESVQRMDDDPATQIHSFQITMPESVSTKFTRKIEFPFEIYPEYLQVKIWQFLLIPVFKNAFENEPNKEICSAEISKTSSLFISSLKSHEPYDIPEDLIICFVQFSLLLLKNSCNLGAEEKRELELFSNTLVEKRYSFDEPFRCSIQDYGRLLSSAIHVCQPGERISRAEMNAAIENWTKLLKETDFPEIAEEALLLVPHTLSRYENLDVHHWMSSMLVAVHELYIKGVGFLTDDSKVGPKKLVLDAIRAYLLHMAKEYKIKSVVDGAIFPNETEKRDCIAVVEKVINIVFLITTKKPHMPSFLVENCYPLLIYSLPLCPPLIEKFIFSCIIMLQEHPSHKDDIVCASLRCLIALLKTGQKIVFERVMACFMTKFPQNKPRGNPFARMMSCGNKELAVIARGFLEVIIALFQSETLLMKFTVPQQALLKDYYMKVFFPPYITSQLSTSQPITTWPKTSTSSVSSSSTSWPSNTGLRISLPNNRKPDTPGPSATFQQFPMQRTFVPSTLVPIFAGLSTIQLRISTPNIRELGTPGPRVSVLNQPSTRYPVPNIPQPTVSALNVLALRALMLSTPQPRTIAKGTSGPRAPLTGTPGPSVKLVVTPGPSSTVVNTPWPSAKPVGTPGPSATVKGTLGPNTTTKSISGPSASVTSTLGPSATVPGLNAKLVGTPGPSATMKGTLGSAKDISVLSATVVGSPGPSAVTSPQGPSATLLGTPRPSVTVKKRSGPRITAKSISGPIATVAHTPVPRATVAGLAGPRATVAGTSGPRAAVAGTLDPRATVTITPELKATVPHNPGQRGPGPSTSRPITTVTGTVQSCAKGTGIPMPRDTASLTSGQRVPGPSANVPQTLRPKVSRLDTQGASTQMPGISSPESRFSRPRFPIPRTLTPRTFVPNRRMVQNELVPVTQASFPWQHVNSETFHLKCLQFLTSTVVKERVHHGTNVPEHKLPAVTLYGDEAALKIASSDIKEMTSKEIEFQSFLLDLKTDQFVSALLQQCSRDPTLAEYVWLSLFNVLLGYKEHNDLLLNSLFKKAEFPAIAERALSMIPTIKVGVEENFIRGPHFMNYLALQAEERLFVKERPVDVEIDQLYSCYFNINADDLAYGLYHKYLTETSAALAYEKVGAFAEAGVGYLSVLNSESIERFPKYQKFASDIGFKRCKEKLMKWSFICEEKYLDCHSAFDSEILDSSCECPQVEGADFSDAFRHMYFLLCPWNVRRDMSRPKSEISKTLHNVRQYVTFKLKRIPSVISPEVLHELKTATRVTEFERNFNILKRFFDVKDSKKRAALLKKDFSDESALEGLDIWDDVHGVRLRICSMFLPNLCDKEAENVASYNNYFTRAAAKTLERGKVQLCSKYLKSVKDPSSNWEFLELRTEATLQTLNMIDDLRDREELLKMAFDQFRRFKSPSEDVQAKCYAYMGRLESLSGSPAFKETAESFFQKSVKLKSFSKNHEWYGDFLEKTFVSYGIGQRPLHLNTAKEAVVQFIQACMYKDKTEAQGCLAKVMGLLFHDEDGKLASALVSKHVYIPLEYWIPLLPQIMEKQLHPLLGRIGNKYPQAFCFAFEEFKSGRETRVFSKDSDLCVPNITPKFRSKAKPFTKELVDVVNKIKEKNAKLLFTIEKIGDELLSLKRTFCDDTLDRLDRIRESVCHLAYECSVECAAASESKHVQHLLETTLRTSLMGEITNILQMRDKLDRSMVEELDQFLKAVKSEELLYNVWTLMRKLMMIITHIIERWEKSKTYKIKALSNYSPFLSTFHLYDTKVGMFRNWSAQCENSVQIARFLPKLEILLRHRTYTCRINLLGSDGQEYCYLIVPISHACRRENRVFQLFTYLNQILEQDRTLPRFHVPSVIPFPHMCLTQDDKGFSSFLYIYTSCQLKIQNNPVVMYYRMIEYYRTLKNHNLKPIHDPVTRSQLFKEIHKLVPKTILKDWVKHSCQNSMEYILFRRKFCSELALLVLAKYCFLLNLQPPDNLLINKRTGVLCSLGLKFNPRPKLKNAQNIISEKGNCTWPPLQLTPNMLEFTNSAGMHGSVALTMAAIGRCFNKNIVGIKAMLNILIFKELEESESNKPSVKTSTAFDEKCFQESKRVIEEIGQLIEGCAKFGNYEDLHKLISDSLKLSNMSLLNPWIYPWY